MLKLDFEPQELRNSLDEKGYYHFRNNGFKTYFQSKFNELKEEMGEKNFLESSKVHRSIMDELNVMGELKDFLYEYAIEHLGYKGSADNHYFVSRKVSPGEMKEKYRAHFDSHLFTIVFPIGIPIVNDDECGELLFFPNVRRNPKNEIENVFGKIYYKKYASKEGIDKLTKKITMIEENFESYSPLLFRGNTFLHTNRAVSKHAKHDRITCLTHLFDPSTNFSAGKILRAIRNR